MIKRSMALSAVVVALASAAHAQSSEAMAFAIGMCSSQTDAQARLACYDQIAAKLRAGEAVAPQASATPQPAPAYTPAPVPQAPAVPARTPAQSFGQAAPETPKEKSSWYDVGGWLGGSDTPRTTIGTPAEFGAESIPPAKSAPGVPTPEPLDQITAKITSYTFSGTGKFTVTLDNGQVWRQIQGDSSTAKFSRDGHESVTISRGFMGSYNLVVAGRSGLYKVRRVQ